jgi:Tfp pilus assembly protein FimT
VDAFTRSSRARSAPGFSTIELLIVLVLLGVTVSIVAPRIDLTRYQIDGAMRSVGTVLLAAQRLAVARQYDVVVGFDVSRQSLRIHEDANGNGQVEAGERVRGTPLGENVRFGLGSAPAMAMGAGPVTFTKLRQTLQAVTFHRGGSASEAGGLYLTTRRALNSGAHPQDTRAITIDRATGRVSWYRYAPPAWRRGF